MSRLQFWLLPILTGIVFLLSGSLEHTAAPVLSIPGAAAESPLQPWLGEPRSLTPALQGIPADKLLGLAAVQFSPAKIVSLTLNFSQQVACEDIRFALKGRYVCAPAEHFRYELEIKIGTEVSRSLAVCDGLSFKELAEMPGKPNKVSTTILPKILKPTDDPALIAAARQAVLQGKAFPGLAQLLLSLKTGLIEPEVRAVQVQGQEMLLIKGKWVVTKSGESPVDSFSLAAEPRECRIYLNPTSLWPRCIEWWGGASPTQPQLLVQTVYDLVNINQPLPAEQAAKDFSTK